jgi:thiosulfate/3-mercaptopyruvate sulfurtransferase
MHKTRGFGKSERAVAYGDFLVGVEELRGHLRDPQWRVVDCRFELSKPDKGYFDYLAGHIPGAVYAHLDHDLAAPVTAYTGRHPLPGPDVFSRTLGRLGIARDTHVIAYDQASGAIAARLWWMLRWMGHPSVRLLDGGFEAWRRRGLPREMETPLVEAVRYVGEPDDSMVLTTAEVENALESGFPLVLVDARDAARFEGRTEPIDTVAGHVPGARNFPFGSSLTAEGYWRSGGELRKAWEDLPGGPSTGAENGSWAAMCGSGVTACHLAVSAGLAGLTQPRLYAGSWSEWIRDAGRSVATGPAADADRG